MIEFYCYEGVRDGATFVVDDDTKEKLTWPGEIEGKAVTITGNAEVGYGKDGDAPLGFVEKVEKERTNSDRLVVSVVWYQSREYVEVPEDVQAGDVLVCDGEGGLKSLKEGSSTAYVFTNDEGNAAVYIGAPRMAKGSVDVGKPKVSRYGFAHNAETVNETIDVSDGADDTFWVIFDRPVENNKYEIDVEIDGHKFTVEATELTPTWKKLYWKLGTTKDDTMFDKVDGQPAAQYETDWPKITAEATSAEMTVKYQSGGAVYGADGKAFTGKTMSLDTTNTIDNTIK